jgi:hypothetical protein
VGLPLPLWCGVIRLTITKSRGALRAALFVGGGEQERIAISNNARRRNELQRPIKRPGEWLFARARVRNTNLPLFNNSYMRALIFFFIYFRIQPSGESRFSKLVHVAYTHTHTADAQNAESAAQIRQPPPRAIRVVSRAHREI